eukprot:m.86733 g.86733  ORF g.86733 m.86733 type:complete len:1485 (+) comp13563_c0_seq2:25-4479(+)
MAGKDKIVQPKRSKSGKKSAAFERWDINVCAAQCVDEQWRPFIFILDGFDRDAQDYADRIATLLPQQRKGFHLLKREDMIQWVRETAKSKGKAKEGTTAALAAEACAQAQLELDAGEISGETWSRLVKVQVMLLRDAALEARALAAEKAREEAEKARLALTTAAPDDRAKTPKTPKKPPPKKSIGKEVEVQADAPGKQRGAIKTRAEEEAERGPIDDRPPHLACFVCLRGFTDAALVAGLESAGLQLDAIVSIRTSPALQARLAEDARAIAAANPPSGPVPEPPPLPDKAALHAAIRVACANSLSGSALRDIAWSTIELTKIETKEGLAGLATAALYEVVKKQTDFKTYQNHAKLLTVPFANSPDLTPYRKQQTAVLPSQDSAALTLANIIAAAAPADPASSPAAETVSSTSANSRVVYRHGDSAARRALSPALTAIENRLQHLVAQSLTSTHLTATETSTQNQDNTGLCGALHTALAAHAQAIGAADPTGLTCIEPLSSAGLAARLLSLASDSRTILSFPMPHLGLVAVCGALASRATPATANTLLPVQYGLTNFLKHVYPTLSDPNEEHTLYEVGDKLLGATTHHDVTVLCAPTATAPSGLVLTRDTNEVPDDGTRVHLAARTDVLSCHLYTATAVGTDRESRSVVLALPGLHVSLTPATVAALRGEAPVNDAGSPPPPSSAPHSAHGPAPSTPLPPASAGHSVPPPTPAAAAVPSTPAPGKGRGPSIEVASPSDRATPQMSARNSSSSVRDEKSAAKRSKAGVRESTTEEPDVPIVPPVAAAATIPPRDCFEVSLAFANGGQAKFLPNGSLVLSSFPGLPFESFRVFRPSGVCARHHTDGGISLLGWAGTTRTRAAGATRWRSVTITGATPGPPDMSEAPPPQLVSTELFDAESGAVVVSREDGLVAVTSGAIAPTIASTCADAPGSPLPTATATAASQSHHSASNLASNSASLSSPSPAAAATTAAAASAADPPPLPAQAGPAASLAETASAAGSQASLPPPTPTSATSLSFSGTTVFTTIPSAHLGGVGVSGAGGAMAAGRSDSLAGGVRWTRHCDGTLVCGRGPARVDYWHPSLPLVRYQDGTLAVCDPGSGVEAVYDAHEVTVTLRRGAEHIATLSYAKPVVCTTALGAIEANWRDACISVAPTSGTNTVTLTASGIDGGGASVSSLPGPATWFLVDSHGHGMQLHSANALAPASTPAARSKDKDIQRLETVHADGSKSITTVGPAPVPVGTTHAPATLTQFAVTVPKILSAKYSLPSAPTMYSYRHWVDLSSSTSPATTATEVQQALHYLSDVDLQDRVISLLSPPPAPRATVSPTPRTMDSYLNAPVPVDALRTAIRTKAFAPYFQTAAGRAFVQTQQARQAQVAEEKEREHHAAADTASSAVAAAVVAAAVAGGGSEKEPSETGAGVIGALLSGPAVRRVERSPQAGVLPSVGGAVFAPPSPPPPTTHTVGEPLNPYVPLPPIRPRSAAAVPQP